MPAKLQKFAAIICIVAAVILAGFLAYQKYRHKKNPVAARADNLQKTLSQTGKAPLFQPEGQMLSQAMGAAATDTPASKKAALKTAEAGGGLNLAKYSYDGSLCKNSPAPYLCLAALYKSLTDNFGSDVAASDIKKRFNENPIVVSDCHPLMHVIGREASVKYQTASEAFAHGDVFCWSGYYHGIMEGLVGKIGLSRLPAQLNGICADISGKDIYSFDYYNCVHGLGHGIMALLDDEVFDSLKMCDNLTGDWEEQSCYSGVFMQNIIDSTNVSDTGGVVKYLKPSDPLYPCDAVDLKYKNQCYLGQTSYALQVTNYNYQNVFNLCAGIENNLYRDTCDQSMGRDIANQSFHKPDPTKQLCQLGATAEDRTNCMIGAVKEIISYYHDQSPALDFCNLYDGDDKNTCTGTAEYYYKLF